MDLLGWIVVGMVAAAFVAFCVGEGDDMFGGDE